MTTINWYPCTDGTTADCGGDTNTMVSDERDGVPAFSAWQEKSEILNYTWSWAAWDGNGGYGKMLGSGGLWHSQQSAMDDAQRWLDSRSEQTA